MTFTNLFNREMPKYIHQEPKCVASDINYGTSLKKIFKEVKISKKVKTIKDTNYGPSLSKLFNEIKISKEAKKDNGAGTGLKKYLDELEPCEVTQEMVDEQSYERQRKRETIIQEERLDLTLELDSDLELSDSDSE